MIEPATAPAHQLNSPKIPRNQRHLPIHPASPNRALVVHGGFVYQGRRAYGPLTAPWPVGIISATTRNDELRYLIALYCETTYVQNGRSTDASLRSEKGGGCRRLSHPHRRRRRRADGADKRPGRGGL